MKHIKLFENFKDIDQICEDYGIENYRINKDGTVDVDGNVNLYYKRLGKLPVKFGKVTGDFNCYSNQLTSLVGCPSYVGGDFNCHENKLITLEGGPSEVGGGFYCYRNKLTSLDGCPKEVGGNFDCSYNPIFNVYNLFGNDSRRYQYSDLDYNHLRHKEYLDSLDYGYLRGTDIIKLRFREALEEIGVKLPKEINGYNYI